MWEYKTATFTLSSRWSARGQEQEQDAFRRILDNHGDDGWELIQYTAVPVVSGNKTESLQHTLIFKRSAEPATEALRSQALRQHLDALQGHEQLQLLPPFAAAYVTGRSMAKQGYLVVARLTGEVKTYAVPAEAVKRASQGDQSLLLALGLDGGDAPR